MARRKLTRREITLLSVLGVVAVIVLYYAGGDSGSRVGGSAASEKEREGPGEAPTVDLARLQAEPVPYDAAGRDLFKYSNRPEGPWERVARQQAAARRELERPKPVVKPPPPPPRRNPAPPRETLPKPDVTYLGYLGPKDNKIAVFEKGGRSEDEDNILIARAGEVFEEKFLLKEINFQSVVIGYTEDRYKGKTTELTVKGGGGAGASRPSGRRGRRR